MSKEVVVVNEKDEVIGTMPRALAHENGTPHRIAVIFVENDNDEILVQIRMSGTEDHSSAGHVDPGESYLQTAQRELREELGIETELKSIGNGWSEERGRKDRNDDGKLEHRTHVFEAFVCKAEPGALAPDEVKGVYWAKPEDILEKMKQNPEKFTGGFKVSLPVYIKWKSAQKEV